MSNSTRYSQTGPTLIIAFSSFIFIANLLLRHIFTLNALGKSGFIICGLIDARQLWKPGLFATSKAYPLSLSTILYHCILVRPYMIITSNKLGHHMKCSPSWKLFLSWLHSCSHIQFGLNHNLWLRFMSFEDLRRYAALIFFNSFLFTAFAIVFIVLTDVVLTCWITPD